MDESILESNGDAQSIATKGSGKYYNRFINTGFIQLINCIVYYYYLHFSTGGHEDQAVHKDFRLWVTTRTDTGQLLPGTISSQM